jgi:Pyridoxamine 5'-phosphate oxidase
MFYSRSNLLGNPQVGMLFINFEKPHRLRLQGAASIDDDDPLLQEYAEAQLVVRVISRTEYEKYINDVEDRESSDLPSSDE